MTGRRILVAGIGNIFFGDDAFGVEVVRRLAQRSPIDGVDVIDFGIRGLDLAYALLDEHEAVILVDTVSRGGLPGTLYLLQPELTSSDASAGALIEPHALDPYKMLHMARSMGGTIERVLLVGCEPQPLSSEDDMQMELSEPVRLAVDEAIRMIESLVVEIRNNQ